MDIQRMLILSKMNLKDADKMCDTMCKELKLVLGRGPGQQSVEHEQAKKMKDNEEKEDILMNQQGAKHYHGKGNGKIQSGKGGIQCGIQLGGNILRENRKDEKGQITRCDLKFHDQRRIEKNDEKRRFLCGRRDRP